MNEYEQILHFLRSKADHRVRLDAGESALVARQLLAVKSRTYDVKYPGLKAREYIPMSSDTNPGADSIAYHQYDQYGAAKIITNNAKDIPRVDVSVAEFTSPVKTIAAAYGYTWLELKRAAMSGVPLPEMKARAARRAIEQGIDDVMSIGNADAGLEGFTNHSAVHIGAAGGAWSGRTALQNYTDLQTVYDLINTQTKGIHTATDIIMPVSQLNFITSQPWATTASDLTVRKFFEQNHPGCRLSSWYRLSTAGAAGVTRLIAYARDPEVVEGQLPLDFEQLPPEAEALEYVVNVLARVGGVQVRYPLAIEYVDGL